MKAVIFDLDDTLISEKDYVLSGYRTVAENLCAGLDTDSGIIYDILKKEFEVSAKNVFNRLYERLGLSYEEEDIKALVKIYREHEPDIAFFEDVLPALGKLRENGLLPGVLSDGYLVTQRNKAKAVELDKFFDITVFTDELGKEYWKPSVRGFEVIAQKTGVELKDMVYVGDNPKKDFEIMKSAPIKTVRIMRKDGVYTDAPYGGECRENKRINSLYELDGILKELFS